MCVTNYIHMSKPNQTQRDCSAASEVIQKVNSCEKCLSWLHEENTFKKPLFRWACPPDLPKDAPGVPFYEDGSTGPFKLTYNALVNGVQTCFRKMEEREWTAKNVEVYLGALCVNVSSTEDILERCKNIQLEKIIEDMDHDSEDYISDKK